MKWWNNLKTWEKGAIGGFVLYLAYTAGFYFYYGLLKKVSVASLNLNNIFFLEGLLLFVVFGGVFGFGWSEKMDNKQRFIKTIFYLAIIVIYYFFLEFFYNWGSETFPVEHHPTMKIGTWGIGDYLMTLTLHFSWPLIALLGYFSRNRFNGMMIAFAIWMPWVMWVWVHARGEFAGMEISLYLFLTILAGFIGALLGFIGSKRRKFKSEGGES